MNQLSDIWFPPHILSRLNDVDAWCRKKGERLTPLRRVILGFILESPKPSGAYDLLNRLREISPKAVPPTIYRTLDFLLEFGLIHRIERLSAFIGCYHRLECHEEGCHHPIWGQHRAQFLICRSCYYVQELEQDNVGDVVIRAAKAHDFTAEAATIEIEGLCAVCSQKAHKA